MYFERINMPITAFNDINDYVKYKTYIPLENDLYICPSNLLESISSFNNLVRVKLETFCDEEDYNPNGVCIIGIRQYFSEDGILQESKIKGNVFYIVNNDNTILTSEGNKYINSYTENGSVKYRLLSKKEVQNKYIIKQVFSITSDIQIGIKISGDVFFNSIDDVNKYLKIINFQGCQLGLNHLELKMNDKIIFFTNYDIFMNGKLLNVKKEDFFKYLDANVKSINNSKYLYDKKYKCYHVDYAILPMD